MFSVTIIGTDDYEVCVEIENNELVDVECSCPYAIDGSYCKHITALLYYFS